MDSTASHDHGAEAPRVEHPIPPFYDERSEVLVLGSFPSPASRAQGFFYGHPQNRMWKMLARLFDEPAPETVERRADFLARHHIAMWDVLASCHIQGASDASIAHEVANNIAPILEAAPIKAIYCAGATAAKLYAKHIEPAVGRPCVAMPSTSPANAAWSLEALVDAWAPLRAQVTDEPEHVLDVADVVALEQAIAQAGTPLAELMDRAGTHLAWRAHCRIEQHGQDERSQGERSQGERSQHEHVQGKHAQRKQACVMVLAGNGNNGGDGWVAARILATWGHAVHLVAAKPASAIEAQPAHDAACACMEAFESLDVAVHVAPGPDELAALLAPADVVVDAILGTGFSHGSVKAPFDAWIAAANEARRAGAYLLSADCPSGLNAQTGQAATPCVQADETLTMIASKTGLHTPAGQAACGTLRIAPLCDLRPFGLPG